MSAELSQIYRIFSLDGGGIRGMFPVAFLANLEEHLDEPIGSYFDLIAGTSTGGIIAIGLGLGLTAREIMAFYEEHGPAVFDQQHGRLGNAMRRTLRWALHWVNSKYSSQPLKDALREIFSDRKLGESKTRLVIPAWHPMLERVYIYKTAHHPRLETDYKSLAVDAAMATAAAPTFFPPHLTTDAIELIDGGVWANNPIGVAVVEAVGTLNWPRDRIKILSIGTTNDVQGPTRSNGKLSMASSLARLFLAGQSHSALGAAKILTGHGHNHTAIWRIDQIAPLGRYTMDDTARIAEMKDRAFAEAREQLPELRRQFCDRLAEPFCPFYSP